MQPPVIRLPAQLPPTPRLLDINRLLRQDAVRLDWSDVQANLVTPQQLDALLHGLILSDHYDRIGGDTISGPLGDLINATFQRANNDPDATISRPIRIKTQTLPQPAVWTPTTTSEVENEDELTTLRNIPTTKMLAPEIDDELTTLRNIPSTRKLPPENEGERTITHKKDGTGFDISYQSDRDAKNARRDS